jgi:hypothetical protein
MKKENMLRILLLLFLTVPWSYQVEGSSDDIEIKCSDTVMKERVYRREATITITVR